MMIVIYNVKGFDDAYHQCYIRALSDGLKWLEEEALGYEGHKSKGTGKSGPYC